MLINSFIIYLTSYGRMRRRSGGKRRRGRGRSSARRGGGRCGPRRWLLCAFVLMVLAGAAVFCLQYLHKKDGGGEFKHNKHNKHGGGGSGSASESTSGSSAGWEDYISSAGWEDYLSSAGWED
eukprot:COSAG01_NODE_1909_length_8928_cov_64.180315_4_plen_123_part_00